MHEYLAEDLSRTLLDHGIDLVRCGMSAAAVAGGMIHAAAAFISLHYGMPLGSWLIAGLARK